MTILFDKVVFGPVHSRRLGSSLGINLLPTNHKYCSFNCIYCECGLNTTGINDKIVFPTVAIVRESLENKLREMQENNELPDAISFAGNGEPTLHPDFAEIIDITIELRNKFSPKSKIAVLSNASRLNNQAVVSALKKVDMNILKLDTAIDETFRSINKPQKNISIPEIIKNLKQFTSNLIIQTLFIRGEYNGKKFDNTTENEVNEWLKYIKELNPELVMIYPIARETPVSSLEKISLKELEAIAEKVMNIGVKAEVYY
jgi:wyosine [tRNA(Phe)-imidazoG37] synthetase (radical SAM superfamily)